MASKMFQPLKIGNATLANRLVMAPLTRARADDNHVPLPFVKEYYTQRSCVPGTLLITEGIIISPKASGLPNVPGIWNEAQILAWKEIVDGVHQAGGIIYAQIWALGRCARAGVKEEEGTGPVVSSSSIPLSDSYATPRPLSDEEILEYIQDFGTAAKNAVLAGFDGVEVHGGSGYLVEQFLRDTCNQRQDRWGGSIPNRARFAIQVMKAVTEAVGADKVAGIRLTPTSPYQIPCMENSIPQFSYLLDELKQLKLGYIHLVREESNSELDPFIELWGHTSPILLAGGFAPSTAVETLERYSHKEIAIGFGRLFISTPDLVYRIRHGIEPEPYDATTFFLQKSKKGYLDYPFSEKWQREHAHL